MADPLLQQQEEPYDSVSDEDFNPDAVPAADADASTSSSEDDAAPVSSRAKPKRKRKAADQELDSGDEITIQASKRRKSEINSELPSDDSGGDGGFIKTRAQRLVEKTERRPIARIDGATADVDAIWARLKSLPLNRPVESVAPAQQRDGAEETIIIKRIYGFAGERHEEERSVPKDSAEARLYLSQQADKEKKENTPEIAPAEEATEADAENTPIHTTQRVAKEQTKQTASDQPSLRRPLRRPSRFDPNPGAEVRAIPPTHQLTWARRRTLINTLTAESVAPPNDVINDEFPQSPRPEKVENLNTVDMSRQDWVQYVDQGGFEEELDAYGKAKEGYTGRMAFLNKVDQAIDVQRREAKAKAST
ncbi:hypothetical protein K490DRAFT_46567 [Saccharata proteae CBS 121410]|uniref:SWR1-complex protein 5 n=1 Tax=Saccharata proteae CBS 121410 TaxID=1314787 RepID=A0A9P4LY24_9PEZI|nr:hypothetical protein K490DRAFT_46567 [Saccharata proteae CBS 121410]